MLTADEQRDLNQARQWETTGIANGTIEAAVERIVRNRLADLRDDLATRLEREARRTFMGAAGASAYRGAAEIVRGSQ